MAQQDNAKQQKVETEKQANCLKDQALSHVGQMKGQMRDGAQHLLEVARSTAQTYIDNTGEGFISAKKTLAQKVKAEPLNALLVAGAVGFLAGLCARGK